MANFDFELQHDLTLTIVWKYPASSDDEERYRNNIEMAMQEIALRVQILAEEYAKPTVDKIMQKFKDLWIEHNPEEG